MRSLFVYFILLFALPTLALTSQDDPPNVGGLHALAQPVTQALGKLKMAQQHCTSESCGLDETCCETGSGPSCCPAAGACCCPDQRFCCVPENNQVMSCVCSGTCPGEGCSCTGCQNGWHFDQCTNSPPNGPVNQTTQTWPQRTTQPALGYLLVPSFVALAGALSFCVLAI